jgi:hypothetical protein
MSDRMAQAFAVEDVADAAALSSDLRTSEAETELGAECASDQMQFCISYPAAHRIGRDHEVRGDLVEGIIHHASDQAANLPLDIIRRGGDAAMIMKQGARTDLAPIGAMSQRAMIAARMATCRKGGTPFILLQLKQY